MARTIQKKLGNQVQSTGQSVSNNEKTEEMNNDLSFDFTVDKPAKTVLIIREFDAELLLVWDAFTKAELIDQWIAPAPITAKTKY